MEAYQDNKILTLLSLCEINMTHNNIKYTNTRVHVKITNTLPKLITIKND